jgi:indolepyruvate ferredoxin oxidoreductase alpha subunit
VEFIYGGDIGCYTLAEAYPYQMIDWVTCMGAGIGIANGMVQVVDTEKQKLIAFIGDSTLFHTGIQPLINAIKNDIDITIIIFNNDWTAMTGHQETLITPREIITRHGSKSKIDSKSFDLIKILAGLGVENLIVTGAYNLDKLGRIFSSNLAKKGTKVIVIKEECTLEKKRRLKREHRQQENTDVYYTISESCVKCNECIETLGCPAINANLIDVKDSNDEERKELLYYIDEARCVPTICPGVCQAVCPNNLIRKTLINPQLEEDNK